MDVAHPDDDPLEAMLGAGSVIGLAVESLMVQSGVGEEEAFSQLVELAESTQCRLRDVAEDVIRQGEIG